MKTKLLKVPRGTARAAKRVGIPRKFNYDGTITDARKAWNDARGITS